MTPYTLYLDEGGGFIDKGRRAEVSLVGGYYCLAPGLDCAAALRLLGDAYGRHGLPEAPTYHAKETVERVPSEVSTPLLRDVLQSVWADPLRGQLVVMRNRGRGSILDNHLTYLHLAAECIVSVLRVLHRKHGTDFSLKVVLATRLIFPDLAPPATAPDRVFPKTAPEDYTPRIREHLALTAYRLALPELVRVLPDVKVASGRTHPNLMVADHVCFGIRSAGLTKGEPSFETELDQNLLDEVVIKDGRTLSLHRSLHETRYADAALEAIALAAHPQSALEGEARRALAQEIVPRLRSLPSRRREHEFRRLFDSIDIRANLQWELARGDSLLSLLEQHVLTPMRDLFRGGEAWIDFRFHQLCCRLANHRGNAAAAKRHLDAANRLAADVVSRWEMVPLWVDLKLDEAVLLTDACAYERAATGLDRLHGTLEPLIGALADELKVPVARADVLGALYGTRLQAHVFAGRRDPGHYAHARRDSDAAMAVFVGSQDLGRQYLYRCHLETDAGAFGEALRWLGRALLVPEATAGSADAGAVVAAIASALRTPPRRPFHLRHYCRLWAAAAATEAAGSLATALAAAWSEARLADVTQPPAGDEYVHPWEVIDWKAGAALLRAGNPAGRPRLTRATERCLTDGPTRPFRPPLYAIGLGCLAEWAALERGDRALARLSQLRSKTVAMLDDDTGRFPDTMQEYFRPWRPVVSQPSPAPEDLLRLARDVAY